MSLLKQNPIVVGTLTAALTLTGVGAFPANARAQTRGGVLNVAPSTPVADREPSFPASLQDGYVWAAANELGITEIYVNYRNTLGTQPFIKVDAGQGLHDTRYMGINDDGVWLTADDQSVPRSNGRPFTVKLADGKAVITLRNELPRGLRNPSGIYMTWGPGSQDQSTKVASNDRRGQGSSAPGARQTQRRQQNPGVGILNNPDVAETLSTVGHNDSTGNPIRTIQGTEAKIIGRGQLLTFVDSQNKSQSYKVVRYSQGVKDPSAIPFNMGAYLYTAPDGNSGILFTLSGTPDGRVTGMPLNAQALAMLKPKSTVQ